MIMEYIKLLFDTVWSLFQTPFPGFEFSIGAAVIGASVAVVGLKIVGYIFGFSFSVSDVSAVFGGVKGGNNKNIKSASAARRGDTK